MARDRKRAKQRQQRRAKQPQNGPRPPLAVERRSTAEPPDPVADASGDAELAKGAIGGEPDVDPLGPDAEAGRVYADELEPETGEGDATGTRDGLNASDELAVGAGGPARRPGSSRTGAALPRGGNRFVNFLRASWAELRRVQWPDRRQVFQATGVVLGFVIIAGGYLGVIDIVAQKIVDAIL